MSGRYVRSYLLDRQRDPARLKRKAFDEFLAAMKSERLIAFTGSYATQHLGYPDWNSASITYVEKLPGDKLALQGHLKSRLSSLDRRFDFPDVMDIAELSAGLDRHYDEKAFVKERKKYARNFGLPLSIGGFRELPSIERLLLHDLGIRRVITLNYDLELEWSAFFAEHELQGDLSKQRKRAWKRMLHEHRLKKKRRIERHVPGFGKVISDILDRSDVAQLASFALLGDDERCRILHLHGRRDHPDSFILSRRDYRDRYWEASFTKLPFEYGLRTILSGNPILFVGIGMSEFEVTKELQQLISDNPNRRAVPMFILWKSSDNAVPALRIQEDNATRLLFYRKFGVHVLFDREIAQLCNEGDAYEADRMNVPLQPSGHHASPTHYADLVKDANRMALPLMYLAKWWATAGQCDLEPGQYRDAQIRIGPVSKTVPVEPTRSVPNRIDIWHASDNEFKGMAWHHYGVPVDPPSLETPAQRLVRHIRFRKHVLAITGEPGSGRGAWAEAIAKAYETASGTRKARIVVINGSFAAETDSVFAILSGSFNGVTARCARHSRFDSVIDMIKALKLDISAQHEPGELVVLINGMERFIAQDGSALSAELDVLSRMLHGLTSDRVRLILLGTRRLLRYLDTIAPERYDHFEISRPNNTLQTDLIDPKVGVLASLDSASFIDFILGKMGSRLPLRDHTPFLVKKREFMTALGKWIDSPGQFQDAELAFQILRILAFIGQPTETRVLVHALRSIRQKPAFAELERLTAVTVNELISKGLILRIAGFGTNEHRLGIHKALVAELRQRYGVPLTEKRLAASFNLGLYAAQPMDNIVPDQRWHDELSKMVDFLIGQFHDPTAIDPLLLNLANQAVDARSAELVENHLDRLSAEQLARLASARQSECLRAALSLMRTFFSTPALLMHGNRGMDPWVANGPLTDHAEQLLRLIRISKHIALVQRLFCKMATGDAAKSLLDKFGPGAVYPDDLAWLNNELGVVFTTQGKLSGAREALEEALRINAEEIEFKSRHQNWRRISLNLAQVLIDSGEIEACEELLRDIESSIEEEARALDDATGRENVLARTGSAFRDHVLQSYAHGECVSHTRRVDPNFPTHLILGTALVLGYRALCLHLRGNLILSLELFDDSLKVLEHIGEQRAYAIVQRHRAALLGHMKRRADAVYALQLCNAAAGPARQTDIDHSGRIALAEYGMYSSEDKHHFKPGETLPQLKETLRYATVSDMYRLQLEALQVMAHVHWRNGDTDSALQHVSDALAIASRNNFGLRKVSLRVLLGRILASRNERQAARLVLREASRLASGLGYARAVEAAEDELVRIDVDNIDLAASYGDSH